MLFTEPVVFFFSLWAAFSWAVLYLQFSAIPLVFRTNHNFNVEQTGAVFTGMESWCRWTMRPRLTLPSHVCRNTHHLRDKRVPGEDRQTLHINPEVSRAPDILCVHTINR